jgi:ABC-2 type transport system permease protein
MREIGDARVIVIPVPRSGYLHFLFPGLVTWTILVGGLLGMGFGMVRHRRSQFLKKLATTPTSPATFVGAQIVGRSVLALAQILLMTGVAVASGLPLKGEALPAVVLVAALGLLTFMGIGFALAAAIWSETAYTDTVNAATVAVLLVSEVFFPVDTLPPALAAASAWLPSTQLVRLLRLLILDGVTDPAALAPGVAILAAWSALTFGLAVLTFRWHGE